METTLHAPGISCQGCANTISGALGGIAGVSGVRVDVASKRVTVDHAADVGREALEGALARAGYPTTAGSPLQLHVIQPNSGAAKATARDPVCGMDVVPAAAAGRSDHDGSTYY